ncbi:unnamed protein product [Urochloa humidicola]
MAFMLPEKGILRHQSFVRDNISLSRDIMSCLGIHLGDQDRVVVAWSPINEYENRLMSTVRALESLLATDLLAPRNLNDFRMAEDAPRGLCFVVCLDTETAYNKLHGSHVYVGTESVFFLY